MNVDGFIKKIQNIMRGDSGVDGDAQRLSQIVWILFLKVFDYKEEEWELEKDYTPVIPAPFRFRDWANPKTDEGKDDIANQLTGDELIDFVNNRLFPFLKGNKVIYKNKEYLFSSQDNKANIVREFISDSTNYMKNGVNLRQVVNEIARINFDSIQERHTFNEIYETLLKGLQSAGKAGEFYTPRALTKFVTEHVNPVLGERVADFACGTGGFLVEALVHLQQQANNKEDLKMIEDSIYGIEWKPLPYMLGTTNLLLHNISHPNILHGDGLAKNLLDLSDKDMFDVILMNPPFGGNVDKSDLANFPSELVSSESADLFVARIIYCLKNNGRCGLVLPDSLLFQSDNSKIALKKKLLSDCNLHTIIRLPKTVFAPYTDINTNLLFFQKGKPTEKIWYYRLDIPKGKKRFNKTNPIDIKDLEEVNIWWDNRQEILDEKEDESSNVTYKSKCYTIKEIIDNNYDLDLCGFPEKEEIILSPNDTIKNFVDHRENLEQKLDNHMKKIIELLGVADETK